MSQCQRDTEHEAFDAFLQARPSLAGQREFWNVQEEGGAFPDILAALPDGQEIGFELGEWVNQEQIAHNRSAERFESDCMKAVGAQPENMTEHIHLVLLSPRTDRLRFDPPSSENLRNEIFDVLEETDKRWSNEPHCDSPQGYHCQEWADFPTLAKYLTKAWFVPRQSGTIRREPLGHGVP